MIATGLAGGRTGSHILDGMTEEGILNDFVRIARRVAHVDRVVDPTSGVQTEIYEYGPEVSDDELGDAAREAAYLSRRGLDGRARRQSAAQGVDRLLRRHDLAT